MVLASDAISGGGGGVAGARPKGMNPTVPTAPTLPEYVDEYGQRWKELFDAGYDESEIEAILGPRPRASGGGGGGSGYIPPDHFFDVNPLDQAEFDWNKQQDVINNGLNEAAQKLNEAKFNWDKAQSERDWALAQGNFELAQQKQADANYWEGISAGFEQQRINLENQGQQLTYAVGMANVEARKQEAANQLQIGMANATNDAERNAVQDRWNQQQALIAKMEDETRRLLGGQENYIAQFGAETDRAARMGDLAQRKNEFIHKMATNARSLPELFMMQRGMAPDWDTLAAGGAVATGDALAPTDPLTAYQPTLAALTASELKLPSSNLPIVSGSVAQGAGGNPYINGGSAVGGGSAGGGAAPAASFLPYQTGATYSAPSTGKTINIDTNAGQQYTGANNGIPVADLKPGMNLRTLSGDRTWSADYLPAYYDEGKTMPVNVGDQVANGAKLWIDYNPGSATGALPKAATGGVYTGSAVVGDDPRGKDRSREEVVTPVQTPQGPGVHIQPINPTGIAAQQRAMAGRPQQAARPNATPVPTAAPAQRNPSFRPIDQAASYLKRTGAETDAQSRARTLAEYGIPFNQAMMPMKRPPTQAAAPAAGGGGIAQVPTGGLQLASGGVPSARQVAQPSGWTPQAVTPAGYDPMAASQAIQADQWKYRQAELAAAASGQRPSNAYVGNGPNYFTDRNLDPNKMVFYGSGATSAPHNQAGFGAAFNATGPRALPRFALGTDVQAQYAANGMGGDYIQNSSNPHLAGMELPTRLKMLADLGMPIAPAVGAAATGTVAPTLNMGNAAAGRRVGVLPSLQALARQSKSETEATRGYYEGVGGMQWGDIVDWLGRPTEYLRSAAVSRGV